MGEKKTAVRKETTVAEAVSELTRKDVVKLEGDSHKDVECFVRICKMRDIPFFLEFVGKLFVSLGVTLDDPEVIERAVLEKMNDGAGVLKLISENWTEVVVLLVKLSNLTKEQVEDLDVDDAFALVKRLVEINYAFFMAKVLPLVPGVIAAKMAEAREQQART